MLINDVIRRAMEARGIFFSKWGMIALQDLVFAKKLCCVIDRWFDLLTMQAHLKAISKALCVTNVISYAKHLVNRSLVVSLETFLWVI